MTITSISEFFFWLGAASLFYTYIGYPLLIAAISTLKPRKVQRAKYEPLVTLIITAYNEERDLAAKLENTLALDYPRQLLEIIVASDCSTDRTDEIAREFGGRGVRLQRQPQRLGKTAAQNAAVEQSHGEVIVFSDATSLYARDALRAMLPNFNDATVGCVGGRLIYVDPGSSEVARGAKSYWGYETFIKQHESRAGSLIGSSGCLYAVRRSAYVPLDHDACSDFLIATRIREQGLRTVFEPQAVCTEETNQRRSNELKMRVRVIAQTYTDLWRHRRMLNPLRSGLFGWQLLSHKVARYLVPLFLVMLLVSSALLAPGTIVYRVMFLVQAAMYAAAVIAWLLESVGVRTRLLALPLYFVLANLAAVMAAYQVLRGRNYARWEPIREAAPRKVA